MATAIKERPILFSGSMVRAILDGSKTQTRRTVKPQPTSDGEFWSWDAPGADPYHCRNTTEDVLRWIIRNRSPYQPGDRLYVRETIRVESFGAGVAQIRYLADNSRGDPRGVSDRKLPRRPKTVPSVHMPRQCSRISLEVRRVRVERLWDISREDVLAEGVGIQHLRKFEDFPQFHRNDIPGMAFREVWDPINAKRGFPFESNPFVWVIEFNRVEE